jgi:hypothetical protein
MIYLTPKPLRYHRTPGSSKGDILLEKLILVVLFYLIQIKFTFSEPAPFAM